MYPESDYRLCSIRHMDIMTVCWFLRRYTVSAVLASNLIVKYHCIIPGHPMLKVNIICMNTSIIQTE